VLTVLQRHLLRAARTMLMMRILQMPCNCVSKSVRLKMAKRLMILIWRESKKRPGQLKSKQSTMRHGSGFEISLRTLKIDAEGIHPGSSYPWLLIRDSLCAPTITNLTINQGLF
ncbi:hypothetical protein BGZ51_000938, partial [Haplosporangium sp. Z 767]